MTKKKLAFHILADDEQFEEFFKEAEQQGVERGLVFRTKANLSEELTEPLSKALKQGYFPVGIILDGFNVEIMFQRHPKQKENNKFVELKTPDNLKYKM